MKKACLTMITLAFILIGCDDTDIAQQMEGSWQGTTTTSYDDGTKDHLTEYITFTKEADKDGGTFTEVLHGTSSDEEDGLELKAAYSSTIDGTWEVTVGDLDLHYDISSLSVSVKESDVDIDVSGLMDEDEYDVQDLYSIKAECAKDLQKQIYKSVFHQYQENNDDEGSYANVKIEGNELSYDTSDEGRISYTRVK